MPNDDPTPTTDRAGHVCSNVELGQQLEDALQRYWDAAYAEGRDGRDHDTEDGSAGLALRDVLLAAVSAERERCVRAIEAYRVPVGNSAAGEMAAEWTMEALREIRDAIRGPNA